MQTINKWVPCDGMTTLTVQEMDDPISVFKSFCGDVSLLAIKQLFSTMIDLCAVAEDVCAPKTRTRQDLFTFSKRMTKLLEAVYLIARRDEAIPVETKNEPDTQRFRHIRVYRTRGSGKQPLMTFCGKWLYEAGFHIGDEIQIAIEAGRLTLTVSRQWSRARQEWRVRA